MMYLLSARYKNVEEDSSQNLLSSKDKAVEWIKKHGQDWEYEDNGDYFYVLMSYVLDCEDFCQPIDEIYFFDKFGNELKNQPF